VNKKHVVILGAGFGGLELATRLSESLADEVHVTLLDQNDSFSFGFSKLDVLFGRTPERTFCSTTATSPERGSSSARSA
jgi:NADH dehydrogenase FAD-containing subunit